jgi:DnaK suppressor protein
MLLGRRARYGVAVDPERAKELLAREREQVEEEIASLEREGPEEGDDKVEPGDLNSEGLYQDELDAGRAQDLKERLAAVERAEGRLEAGTYGLSTQSGSQIPDQRLEAFPTTELTVDEQERGGG